MWGGGRLVLFKIFDKHFSMGRGHLGTRSSRVGAIAYWYESIYVFKSSVLCRGKMLNVSLAAFAAGEVKEKNLN